MRTLLKILLATFVVGALIGTADEAAAQSVDVEVRSIAATKSGDHFDPELKDLKSKLQTAFGGYSSFELVDSKSFKLDKKESNQITVPGGTKVKLTFHGMAGSFFKLGLSVADKLHTTLRAAPESTFFQAGLSYKSGILILAITVE